MYRELKKQIADKKVIDALIDGLTKRIQYKIDNQLGLKGMSFQEVKIEMQGKKEDKFASVFAKIEDIDRDRSNLKNEVKIIDDMLNNIDEITKNLDDIEFKVFKGMYLYGLTQQQIAERENYSIDWIKHISMDINKKIKN